MAAAPGREAHVTADQAVLREARENLERLSARAGVHVTELRGPQDAELMVGVLNAVWGSEADIVDHALLTALGHAGCYVSCAWRGEEMVGAGVAFFGAEPGVLHSHVLGAVPGQADRGVGQAVKAHSRLWCLERGIAEIHWTFDPMQARNAYLNLHHFGAQMTDYVDDFYGDLHDGLNTGFPTDRAVLVWDVTAPRAPLDPVPDHAWVVLRREGSRPGPTSSPDACARWALVDLPPDIDALRADDPEAALAWAQAYREVFHHLLDTGWSPRDVLREGTYVWERNPR